MSIYKDPIVIKRIRKSLQIRSRALEEENICFVPGCSQEAINSHIIQRSQFLQPIADSNDKLRCFETKETYPGKLPRFLRIPIRNILTFKGFCSYHDQMIFSEIEKSNFDLNNHRHLILFNYRAICHELRKKRVIVKWYEGLENDNEDFPFLPNEEFEISLKGYKLGIKDLEFYKTKMEEDLIKNSKNFIFEIHILPYKEIVSSACFSIENITFEEAENVNNPNWEEEPLKACVFTIFPFNQNTILIFGYLDQHKSQMKKFISEMGGINLDFINKVILEWVETWACSEQFYKSNVEKDLEKIQNISFSVGTEVPANYIELPNLMK